MDDTAWILPFVFSIILSFTSASNCRFPLEWHGTWFQSRMGEIQISATSISPKGTCVQREGFKFLVTKTDKRHSCFICMVITQMHENLLQYKESFCYSDESFVSVCNKIQVDATLHTIIKVPSRPVPCPFQGPYEFSYANGSMATEHCSSPISTVQSCADPSKFKFIYRHCRGMHGTYDQELGFQCLATWENGEKFLYGKFTGAYTTESDQMYRCFMHSFYGSTGDMSMSAEATCQGLQSPTVGFLTMGMNKVDWPRPNCAYPDFFTRRLWRDLSGSYQIEVIEGGHEFRITDRFPNAGTIIYDERVEESQIKLSLRCHNLYQVITDSGRFRKQKQYITYSTNDDCKSGYQCIRLTKRSSDVLELEIGEMIFDSNIACDEYYFKQEQKFVLIADEGQSTPCPFIGQYTYTDKASPCGGEFKIGCQNENEIIIETECPGNQRSVEILQCMHVWEEDAASYVITQEPVMNELSNRIKKTAECLAFTKTSNGIEVQSDPECGGNRLVIMSEVMNLVLHTPSEPCQSKRTPSTSTPQNAQLSPNGIPPDFSSIINSGVQRTHATNILVVGQIVFYILTLTVR